MNAPTDRLFLGFFCDQPTYMEVPAEWGDDDKKAAVRRYTSWIDRMRERLRDYEDREKLGDLYDVVMNHKVYK